MSLWFFIIEYVVRLKFQHMVLRNSCNKYMAYKAFSSIFFIFLTSHTSTYIILWCVTIPLNKFDLTEGTQSPFNFCLPLFISIYYIVLVLPPAPWRAHLNNFDGHFREIKILFSIINKCNLESKIFHLRPHSGLQ